MTFHAGKKLSSRTCFNVTVKLRDIQELSFDVEQKCGHLQIMIV